jgi:hypothetical protein
MVRIESVLKQSSYLDKPFLSVDSSNQRKSTDKNNTVKVLAQMFFGGGLANCIVCEFPAKRVV